ncbi:MAG TPA: outer membrane protein assembly factor BamD [Candidatus Aminicenantes bacterium]|nr:outer membrane protein assembly factor BamD [Candidatus Aminicenantes bacterium]
MTRTAATKTAVLLLTVLLAAAAPGCRKKPVALAADLSGSDEALYRLGEASIKSDMEKGILYLRQVIDSFPKSFYAQRAKLLIADAYFRKGDESNMILAAAEYREFIRTYPYSPSAAYSQYQVAMTFFKKMLRPGRDPSRTIQALAEFKKVIADYPASDQAKQAQERVKECEERLASHSTEIAISYHGRRSYRAALSRLMEVMSTYPEYSRLDKVYFYLGDCNFQLRLYDQAAPFFSKVVSDYSGQKLAKTAAKKLAEIERLKKAAAAAAAQKKD